MKNEKKQELSDQIAEGIDKGFWKPIGTGIIIFGVIMVLYVAWLFYDGSLSIGGYEEYEQQAVSIPDKCIYERLNCYVVDWGLSMKASSCNKEGTACGGPVYRIREKGNICGYQEANAWFEQYKNKLWNNKERDLFLECY